MLDCERMEGDEMVVADFRLVPLLLLEGELWRRSEISNKGTSLLLVERRLFSFLDASAAGGNKVISSSSSSPLLSSSLETNVGGVVILDAEAAKGSEDLLLLLLF